MNERDSDKKVANNGSFAVRTVEVVGSAFPSKEHSALHETPLYKCQFSTQFEVQFTLMVFTQNTAELDENYTNSLRRRDQVRYDIPRPGML